MITLVEADSDIAPNRPRLPIARQGLASQADSNEVFDLRTDDVVVEADRLSSPSTQFPAETRG